MKKILDRSINNIGKSSRRMLGAVLLVSGVAIMIGVITAPFAIGVDNYSEDGRLLMSILPWVAAIEIAFGLLIVAGQVFMGAVGLAREFVVARQVRSK